VKPGVTPKLLLAVCLLGVAVGCTPPEVAGAPCNSDSDCLSSDVCRTGTCEPGTRAPPATDVDAGPATNDAGVPDADAGGAEPETDGGELDDGGPPPVAADGGGPAQDAGVVVVVDAGVDGGRVPGPDAGCDDVVMWPDSDEDGVSFGQSAVFCTLQDVPDGWVASAASEEDNCPDDANADQNDEDGDGVGDVCDNCPADANPGQLDALEQAVGEAPDGVGDACDPRPLQPGDSILLFDAFVDDAGAGFSAVTCDWAVFQGVLAAAPSTGGAGDSNCLATFDLDAADVWVKTEAFALNAPTDGTVAGPVLSLRAGQQSGDLCGLRTLDAAVIGSLAGGAAIHAATPWAPDGAGSPVHLGAGGSAAQMGCAVDDAFVFESRAQSPRGSGGVGLFMSRPELFYLHVVVYGLGGPVGVAQQAPPPVHRWPFEDDGDTNIASDVIGGAHGELHAGASVDPNGFVELDGNDDYVDLPNGLISSLDAVTFEAWVRWDGNAVGRWQRVFDFGTNNLGEIPGPGGGPFTANASPFIQLSPQISESSGGTMRVTVFDGVGGDNLAYVDGPSMEVGRWVHTAVTYDPAAGWVVLYVDGGERSREPMTMPLSTIVDVNNWLGRSNWSPDPGFDGAIDEFRLYDRALTPAEVLRSFSAGPGGPGVPSP
jgi:hypothetical protein